MNRRPRQAKQEEIGELVKYQQETFGLSEDEARPVVENAYIAVFDPYTTDCPGFSGKLMLVVWSGDPSFYECFYWPNRKLVKLQQERI